MKINDTITLTIDSGIACAALVEQVSADGGLVVVKTVARLRSGESSQVILMARISERMFYDATAPARIIQIIPDPARPGKAQP